MALSERARPARIGRCIALRPAFARAPHAETPLKTHLDQSRPVLPGALWAALLSLVLLVGCLPPKRSNEPLPDVEEDATTAADGTAADGASGGDVDQDAADGAADADTVEVDAGPAPLPKGCTEDSDCAPLAFGPCQDATCVAKTGLCVVANKKNGTPCDDGDACFANENCTGGTCAGVKIDCDDGKLCTIDACLPDEGCVHTDAALLCDDGDPCTLEDRCKEGACVGVAKSCDAANTACATASCNPQTGACNLASKMTVTSCDDGDACTKDDTCSGLECKGIVDCDDGDPCTDDFCPPGGLVGCLHLPMQGATKQCKDDDPCVEPSCVDGICVKAIKDCDDDLPCTADACDGGTCSHTKLESGSCEDGNPCSTDDACIKGQCKSSSTLSCDDGNVCTDDACVDFEGCTHKANTKSCNDGSACTHSDLCKAGVCGGTPKNCDDGEPCTTDVCSPLTGSCTHDSVPDGTACAGGSCASGVCKKGDS